MCYISFFKLFRLIQTRVLQLLATSAPEKIIWDLTLPVQFSPPHAGKGQIPHSPGTEDSQMPGLARGGGMLKYRFRRPIMRFRQQTITLSFLPSLFLKVEHCLMINTNFMCFLESFFRDL